MKRDFTHKYRPAELRELIGQDDARRTISKWLKNEEVPPAILFHGPSGTGKTTLARILRDKLECDPLDFIEHNTADFRGIDSIRDIRRGVGRAPIGKCKIWLLDEAHQMTGAAQDAMLKVLEDTPPNVYFFLATTDPGKLKKTIRTRCSPIGVKSLSAAAMQALLTAVATAEKIQIEKEVLEKITDHADGSARTALKLLHKIARMDSTEDQVDAIERADHKTDSIEIFRALMNPRNRWPDVAKVLRGADIEDAEGIRRMILACCCSTLLNGKASGRAALIIDVMRDPLFDCGKAGLVGNCFQIAAGK